MYPHANLNRNELEKMLLFQKNCFIDTGTELDFKKAGLCMRTYMSTESSTVGTGRTLRHHVTSAQIMFRVSDSSRHLKLLSGTVELL